MTPDLFDSVEPMIASIAAEYGRRHHVHGADAEDFQQQLRIWVLEHKQKVGKWLDADPEGGMKMLAKSLRNEAKDYALDIKAQAVGYDPGDLYFYGKTEVRALLPSALDPEVVLEGAPDGLVAARADVAAGFKRLGPEDRALLEGFHLSGWTNKMMAQAEGVSEQLMSYRHTRAVNRLVKILSGSGQKPQRDPWKGRSAIGNGHAQAITGSDYE